MIELTFLPASLTASAARATELAAATRLKDRFYYAIDESMLYTHCLLLDSKTREVAGLIIADCQNLKT